ncbi:energy transducer TonB [Myroides sp. JBRI-B21084]|uniref:energy transducer TonB n=1 Tax=Myroides sp. JBRI-B21084 TaxID=3119977 RepID=UPI0026E3C4EF|nr:energy transducer TonB [Paenimyroides cloacae]WKW47501.1 energy transducer TonB [Paenimyroides cloacae]
MMHFTTEEKKSMVLTTAVAGVLLLILLFIRFANATTFPNLAGGGGGGVEINFGDSELGMGPDFSSEILNVTESSKNKTTQAESVEEEEILAQENTTDARDFTVVKKTTTPKEKLKTVTQPVKNIQTKNKVSDFTKNALSSLNGNKSGGDGNDNVAGNKGKKDGSLSSNNYYGDGGSGGGTGGGHGTGNGTGVGAGSGSGTGGGNGYSLSGRKATTRPTPQNNCNEAGTIVVRVTVDRNGNVISALPGIKGSTNTSSCLKAIAKDAALRTKWEPKSTAPDNQIGSIVYNFKLR